MKLWDLVPRFKTEPWCLNFEIDENGEDVVDSIFPYSDLDKNETSHAIAMITAFSWLGFSVGNFKVKDLIDWDDYHNNIGC